MSSLPRHLSAAWRGERVSSERVELAHPDVFFLLLLLLPGPKLGTMYHSCVSLSVSILRGFVYFTDERGSKGADRPRVRIHLLTHSHSSVPGARSRVRRTNRDVPFPLDGVLDYLG